MFPVLIQLVVGLIIVGLILWVVQQIPMDAVIARIIRVVVIVAVVIWLLYLLLDLFGMAGGAPLYFRR